MGGVILLGVVWIVVTAFVAFSKLDSIRDRVDAAQSALVAGRVAEAQRIAGDLQGQADSAHFWTSGPAWWAGAQVPWLGGPAASIREAAEAVNDLAHIGLQPALRAGVALTPDQVLTADGRLDLARVAQAAPLLRQATSAVHGVVTDFGRGHLDTWLNPIDAKRVSLSAEVRHLASSLDTATRATRLLPAMLGANGPREYFVGFMNEAEARGLGGLPGSYAILRADDGKMRFTHFGSDTDFLGVRSTATFGRDWRLRYGQGFSVTDDFRNSTASPHFPYAAATWLSMYEHRFGSRLDGAIALDPTTLGYLLKATGPVTLPEGALAGDDVAATFENGIYGQFPGLTQESIRARKHYLNAAARAVGQQLTGSGDLDAGALFTGLVRAVRERRLLAYSADPAEQSALASTSIAGILPDTNQPFLAVVVNNSAGSKLDYYLARTVTYERSTCAAATATITVQLRNAAPATGLPDYLTYTTGLGHAAPGVNADEVALYVTRGADVRSVTVDGKRAFVQGDSERGHPVISLGVTLQPGQTRTLVYTVKEPAATGPLLVQTQPLVYDQTTKIRAPSCHG